jgi:hypothetical protein
MKEEHWRIIIADMECPFRQPLVKNATAQE